MELDSSGAVTGALELGAMALVVYHQFNVHRGL